MSIDTKEVDLQIAKAALERAETEVTEAKAAYDKACQDTAATEAEALAAFEKDPTDANWATVTAARAPRERAEILLRATERRAEEPRATFQAEQRAVFEMQLADARQRGSVQAFFASIRADLQAIMEADQAMLAAVRRIYAAAQQQHTAAREVEQLCAKVGDRGQALRVQLERLSHYIGRALFEGRKDAETQAWLRKMNIDPVRLLQPQIPGLDSPPEAEFFQILREPTPSRGDVTLKEQTSQFVALTAIALADEFGARHEVSPGQVFHATPEQMAGLSAGSDYDFAG